MERVVQQPEQPRKEEKGELKKTGMNVRY